MKLTIKEIAQVLSVSGIVDEREISSVEFDSRKIEKAMALGWMRDIEE